MDGLTDSKIVGSPVFASSNFNYHLVSLTAGSHYFGRRSLLLLPHGGGHVPHRRHASMLA